MTHSAARCDDRQRIDVSEADAHALVAQQLAIPVTDDLITAAVQKAMEQAFAGC